MSSGFTVPAWSDADRQRFLPVAKERHPRPETMEHKERKGSFPAFYRYGAFYMPGG